MLAPIRRQKLLDLVRTEVHWLVYVGQHVRLQNQVRVLASERWKFVNTVDRVISPDICEEDFKAPVGHPQGAEDATESELRAEELENVDLAAYVIPQADRDDSSEKSYVLASTFA